MVIAVSRLPMHLSTPPGRLRFAAVARRRAPAQLVAQRLVEAVARNLHESERHRRTPDDDAMPIGHLRRSLPVDDHQRRLHAADEAYGELLVRRLDDRPI